jgi:hypothetical protein
MQRRWRQVVAGLDVASVARKKEVTTGDPVFMCGRQHTGICAPRQRDALEKRHVLFRMLDVTLVGSGRRQQGNPVQIRGTGCTKAARLINAYANLFR